MADEVNEVAEATLPDNAAEQVTEEVTEINPAELSEEDLDKLLQDEPESQEEQGEEEDSTEQEKKSAEAEQKPAKAKDEQEAKPKTEEVVKPNLEEENTKLRARLTQQEEFIQRRNTELGRTRAKLTEAIELLKAKVDETFVEKPSEGVKLQKQIETLEGKVEEIDAEKQALNENHNTQMAVAKFIKPGETSIEDMAKCLSEDGIEPAIVENFKKNPFMLGAAATVHLAKRASLLRQRDEAREIAIRLHKRNQELEKRPSKIVKQIASVAKQRPAVNGGSGKSPTRKVVPSNPALLSDKELDAALELAND